MIQENCQPGGRMSQQESLITLYVMSGPDNAELARNARTNQPSRFTILSSRSGVYDFMYIHVPLEATGWGEFVISGTYKVASLRYRMIYYTMSRTGVMYITRAKNEEDI